MQKRPILLFSQCSSWLAMLVTAPGASRAEEPERAQAVGQYNVTLAQFFKQVFAAAEGAGAAAILPYKFIPYAYEYNRTLYEFGTNTAAYKCSVAAMFQYQEQRVNPDYLYPLWHTAPCAPVTCDQGLNHRAP